MSNVNLLYCGGCGVVRQIQTTYGSVNTCDCGVIFTRVSMNENEFEKYEHLMVIHGLVEFMRMYNNGEIDE